MSPEIVISVRQRAIEDINKVVDPRIGIPASAGGRFEQVHFGRDSTESIIMASEEDQGELTPFLVDAANTSLTTAITYEGQGYHSYRGERPGKKAHEAHTGGLHQDRLGKMWEENKQRPRDRRWPVLREANGTFSMVDYYSDDATPKFNIAVGEIERTISRHYGNSRDFLETMWPPVKRGFVHDIRQIDRGGVGVLVSEGKGGIINHTWMDSDDAYMDEEGNIPKPSYVFLSVNAAIYRSFVESSRLARLMGEEDVADELLDRAVRLKKRIDQLFWSDKFNYFVPLLEEGERQVEIETSDAVDAMWMGAIYPHRAGFVVGRVSRPDMMTAWGIRTRSSESKVFAVNSYHKGSIWPKQNSQAAKGAENYGFFEFARTLDERNHLLAAALGSEELTGVDVDGVTLKPYEEDGIPVSNNPHSWSGFGCLARTAANLNRPEVKQGQRIQVLV